MTFSLKVRRGKEGFMKESYVEPVLERQDEHQEIIAGGEPVVSGDLQPS
jgi:hypothetical protein